MTSRATDRFIALDGGHIPPFTSWVTAATTIQAAIDVAEAGDYIWVSNGVYRFGGREETGGFTNRIVIDKPVVLLSVNGPEETVVEGGERTRCARVCSGARLEGLTFQWGSATGSRTNQDRGGGVFAEQGAFFLNCCFVSNYASEYGGGAFGGTYENCRFIHNGVGPTDPDMFFGTLYQTGAGGGGAAYAELTNCLVANNWGGGIQCSTATVCAVVSNEPYGARHCLIRSCLVAHNASYYRGGFGVDACAVDDSIIEYNGTSHGRYYEIEGGGARYSTIRKSVVRHNRARCGGGAYNSLLENCFVISNWAESCGGGVRGGTSYNCFIGGNWAYWAGGSCEATLYNCTVVDNSAEGYAAIDYGIAYNCIIWSNCAPWNPDGSAWRYNCNTGDPGIVSLWNPILPASSPCIDAGTNQDWMAGTTDLAGRPRISNGQVDIGAFEFSPADRTGTISVALFCSPFAGTTDQTFHLVARVDGNPLDCRWDTGDGLVVSGHTEIAHTYVETGVYQAVFVAWNSDGSVTASLPVYVVGRDIHVAPSGSDINLGDSWQRPKRTIQGAIDGAWPGCERVLVSNGVYDSGGCVGPLDLTNRVCIYFPLRLESVNGPAFTIIKGSAARTTNGFGPDAVRCIYAATSAWISGFTIYGGHTHTTATWHCWTGYGRGQSGCIVINDLGWSGGGLYCADTNVVVSNCIFMANRAYANAGGLCRGYATDCVFLNNEAVGCDAPATGQGGGGYDVIANNCVFLGNAARRGGGMALGDASHCYYGANWAQTGGGVGGSSVHNSVFSGNRGPYGAATGNGAVVVVGTYGYVYEYLIYTFLENCLVSHNCGDSEAVLAWANVNRSVICSNSSPYVHVIGVIRNSLICHNSVSRSVCLYDDMYNCTIIRNHVTNELVDPIIYGHLINSILVSNTYVGGAITGTYWASHSCSDLFLFGDNNVFADPGFVDFANGDYRLVSNSPCINQGTNLSAESLGTTDLDGNPRVQCGAPDIGAYESPFWGMHSDVDNDGITDWNEVYVTWTDPTNPLSCLSMEYVPHWELPDPVDGLVVQWRSQTGRFYNVYRATNLLWNIADVIFSNVPGCEGITSVTDSAARVHSAAFYWVNVAKP